MWNYLKTVEKPIVLYGMGNGADKILNQLNLLQIPVAGVFASDEFVRGQSFHGYPVLTYAQAKKQFGEMVILVCFGSQRPEVLARLKALSLEQELYAPDVPVVGETIFNWSYCQSHLSQLEQVYHALADELSRITFLDILQYKLTGKISSLFHCETPASEVYSTFFQLGSQEVYLDLGAYTGDTIADFCRHVSNYSAIYAVEPDRKNFQKLLRNTQFLSNCHCFQMGIHRHPGQMQFSSKGGRQSAIGNKGTTISVDSVDHLFQGIPFTYIKMDIEGQESAAIAGAQETISRLKPKLLISAYHRTEDLFTLPLQILSLRADYKVYLRHHPYVPCWDTNYYFV